MAYCTDALSQGWQHTVRILFSPWRVGFWLQMAFFMFIIEDLFHISPMKYISKDVMETAMEDPTVLEPILMQLLVIGVVYFFLVLIFMLMSCAARMVYLTGVRNGFVTVLKTVEELLPRIITYYLWNVIVPLIGFVIFFIFTLIFAFAVLLPLGVSDPLSAGIAVLIIMAVIGLAAFFFVMVYLILMRSFVVPQMVFLDKGIFQAWGSAFGLIFRHFFETVGFFFIRFALIIALLVVLIIPLFGAAFLFDYIDNVILRDHDLLRVIISNANILLLSLIIEPLLLPYNIFVDSYSLAFLKQLTGDSRLLPDTSYAGANSTISNTTYPQTPPPVFQSVPPQKPIPPMQYGPLSNEPVAFKDIPVDSLSGMTQMPPENVPGNLNGSTPEEPKNDPAAPPPQFN